MRDNIRKKQRKSKSWEEFMPGFEARSNKNTICARSKEHPELHFIIDTTANPDLAGFEQRFAELRACTQEYHQLASEFSNLYGLTKTYDGQKIHIHQASRPDIFSFSPQPDPSDTCRRFASLKKVVEIKCQRSKEIITGLQNNGLTICRTPTNTPAMQALKIDAPTMGEPVYVMAHGTEGMVSHDQLDMLEKLRLKTLPDSHKVVLIFDGSALSNLAEAYSHNIRQIGNPLEIASRLPTVEAMYIPAHVADWELRGLVKDYNAPNSKNALVQADSIFTRNTRLKKLVELYDALFKGASRVFIDKDGTQHVLKKGSSNLIIYEDEEYKNHCAEVLRLMDNAELQTWQKGYQIHMLREHAWADMGEKSMERITQHLPGKHPVFLISDDLNYLRHRDPIVTNHGAPVGSATTPAYLRAEAEAGQEFVNGQLVHPVTKFTVNEMLDAIGPRYQFLKSWPQECTPGFIPGTNGDPPLQGESLKTFMGHGIALLPQRNFDTRTRSLKPKAASFVKMVEASRSGENAIPNLP